MTVVVESVENKFSGKVFSVQEVALSEDDFGVSSERAIMPHQVIVVAHDIVNDKVVLEYKFRLGAMSQLRECPQGFAEVMESTSDAAKRILKESTGLEPKSIIHAHSLMTHINHVYGPVEVFYVTVDTRPLLNEPKANIELVGAKELIQGVRKGYYKGLGCVLGANYIKANRNRG